MSKMEVDLTLSEDEADELPLVVYDREAAATGADVEYDENRGKLPIDVWPWDGVINVKIDSMTQMSLMIKPVAVAVSLVSGAPTLVVKRTKYTLQIQTKDQKITDALEAFRYALTPEQLQRWNYDNARLIAANNNCDELPKLKWLLDAEEMAALSTIAAGRDETTRPGFRQWARKRLPTYLKMCNPKANVWKRSCEDFAKAYPV